MRLGRWNTHTPFLLAKPFYQNSTNLHTRRAKRIPAGLGRFRRPIVGFRARGWCFFSVGLLFGGRELPLHCVPEQTPFFGESDFISCCSSGSTVLFSVWMTGSIKPKQHKLIRWTLITPAVLYYSTAHCLHSSLRANLSYLFSTKMSSTPDCSLWFCLFVRVERLFMKVFVKEKSKVRSFVAYRCRWLLVGSKVDLLHLFGISSLIYSVLA